MVVRNITFSAEEEIIEKARHIAESRQRSLNEEFREWLANYVQTEKSTQLSLREVIELIPKVTLPKKYTREEMNERR